MNAVQQLRLVSIFKIHHQHEMHTLKATSKSNLRRLLNSTGQRLVRAVNSTALRAATRCMGALGGDVEKAEAVGSWVTWSFDAAYPGCCMYCDCPVHMGSCCCCVQGLIVRHLRV
jgi:hypothetical protein